MTCGLQMRIAYSGLIFRKVSEKNNFSFDSLNYTFLKMLRLSSHTMNNLSSGEITNLLGNDANKIEIAHIFFNYLWVCLRKFLEY